MKRGGLTVLAIVIGAALAIWLAMPGVQTPHPKASGPDTAPTLSASDTPDARVPARASDARAEPDAAGARHVERARPQGAKVVGRVIDGLGNPLSGIGVTLVDAHGAKLDQVTSARDGRYETADLDLRGSALELEIAPGPTPDWQKQFVLTPPLAPGETRTMDLVAVGGRALRGFVLDLAGDPVAGARVIVGTPIIRAQWSLVTDAGGRFTLTRAPREIVVVRADLADVGSATATIPAGTADTTVDLVLTPTTTLTVLAPDLGPAETVVVTFGDPDTIAHYASDEARWEALHRRILMLPEDKLKALDDLMDSQSVTTLGVDSNRFLASALARVEPGVVAAEGKLGEPITLTGGVWYRVALGGSTPRDCGAIHLAASQEATLSCTHGTATISGQIVDEGAKPVEGIAVGWRDGSAVTDARGRFQLQAAVDGAASGTLTVATGGLTPLVLRRNVVVSAGQLRDLGRVVVHVGVSPEARNGQALGATLDEDDGGFYVQKVARDSALELAGIDPGDRVIAIDEEDALELPIAEALARMEAKSVMLRIRTESGEIYDLEVTP